LQARTEELSESLQQQTAAETFDTKCPRVDEYSLKVVVRIQ
jgi:hypothetical protein